MHIEIEKATFIQHSVFTSNYIRATLELILEVFATLFLHKLLVHMVLAQLLKNGVRLDAKVMPRLT